MWLIVDQLQDACRAVDQRLRTDPAYAHTSHFLVLVDDQVVYDEHYRGPVVADVFSVTKSVVATLVGIAVRHGLIADLDQPVDEILSLGHTPSAGQSLRHLLTMTRGSETDGSYEIDEVMSLPGGWVDRIASAPRVARPGAEFRYDNGGSHLLGAAVTRLIRAPLSDYAAERLFEPLGIADWLWPHDPDGVDYGFAHLRLPALALGRLGQLWLQHGSWNGAQLVDPAYARQMTSAQNAGGDPELKPYGYGIWVDDVGPFAGGWAGQHVTTVRAARAVVVTTGDPQFDPGPPPTDQLAPGWRPARELVVKHVVPALLRHPS